MTHSTISRDVLVIGAGPAGIAAAAVAAETGLSVAVLDQSPWVGGQIWRDEETRPTNRRATEWTRRLRKSGADVFCCSAAFASPRPGAVLAETSSAILEFSGRNIVLATGARELLLPFPGWTLPGVVAAGGLHLLARSGWPVAGRRVVVSGTGPLLWAAAEGLHHEGARVVRILDQAALPALIRFGLSLPNHPDKLGQAFRARWALRGTRFRPGSWIVRAEGEGKVERVIWTDGRRQWVEPCDLVACGFHLVPNLEWPLLLGCALDGRVVRVDEWQETSVRHVYCAGEPTGIGGVDCALIEGQIAGWVAAGRRDLAARLFPQRAAAHRFRRRLDDVCRLRAELRHLPAPETFVCRCEDVPHGEMTLHDSWRSARLHSRCGMGACQGRVCGSAAAFLYGWSQATIRPPVVPVEMASLAFETASIQTQNPKPETP